MELWDYECVRTDSPLLKNPLEDFLKKGYEPFFVTFENGKRYVHLRRHKGEYYNGL